MYISLVRVLLRHGFMKLYLSSTGLSIAQFIIVFTLSVSYELVISLSQLMCKQPDLSGILIKLVPLNVYVKLRHMFLLISHQLRTRDPLRAYREDYDEPTRILHEVLG